MRLRARESGGGARLGRIVAPAEEAKGGVVERLDAKRKPVHPGLAIGAEAAGIAVAGIGLEGDLGRSRGGPSSTASGKAWGFREVPSSRCYCAFGFAISDP